MSGEGPDRMVEVTHDALFTAWPQLKVWLDDEQDFLHARRQIEEAERMWQAAPSAEKPRALLSGLLLARARDWQRNTPERLAPVADFVTASIRRRGTVRRRQVLAGLGAAAAVGVAGTVGARKLNEVAAYQRAREEERNRTDLTGDLIVYSTSPGGSALDGTGRNGAFTGALLSRLSDPSYSVTRALMASVQETLDVSEGRQRPELVSNLNGDIYLADAPQDRTTVVLPIGVGDYAEISDLKNSVNDARDVAALFSGFGYAAEPLINCTRATFADGLGHAMEPLKPRDISWRSSPNPLLHRVSLQFLPGTGGPSDMPPPASAPDTPSDTPPPASAPDTPPAENSAPTLDEPEPAAEPRNSVFVVYFSGQGFSVDGETYLAMADTPNISDPEAVKDSAIRVSALLHTLQKVAAVRILILDTARDNPFAR